MQNTQLLPYQPLTNKSVMQINANLWLWNAVNELGMVVPTYNVTAQETRETKFCEFQASEDYRVRLCLQTSTEESSHAVKREW